MHCEKELAETWESMKSNCNCFYKSVIFFTKNYYLLLVLLNVIA